MAAASPPQLQEKLPPAKKMQRKRKRTNTDPEIDRFDSLRWNPSLSDNQDENFSVFVGSGELDGGFMSLEEVDEADYGLVLPGAVEDDKTGLTEKITEENGAKTKKKKKKNKKKEIAKETQDDSATAITETMVEEDQTKSKKKRKKSEKKENNKETQDGSATAITEAIAEENQTKTKKKKKKSKKKESAKETQDDSATAITETKTEENQTKTKKKRKKSAKKKAEEIQYKKMKRKAKKEAKKEKELNNSAIVCNDKDEREDEMVDEPDINSEFSAWYELRLHPLVMKSIQQLRFKEPTPIQKACIPAAAHQGKDVIGAAETGSGKTLAFGLPILQRLLDEREKAINLQEEKGEEAEKYAPRGVLRALIIAPTRELALQVTDHLKQVAKSINIRVVPIVGGISSEKQERLLQTRPEIIVGTPGRLWQLMSNGEKHLVELHSLSFFVLDEADRMVETGHFRELQSIIEMLPAPKSEEQSQNVENCMTVASISRKKRQTLVFSATLALSADFRKKLKRGSLNSKQSAEGLNSIEILSERAGMRANAAIVDLTSSSILAEKLEESFIECSEDDKDAYLYYILSIHGEGRTIVFCTSIAALRHISSQLRILGVDVLALHAQMQQRARLKAVERFRANEHGVLVASDVAARGLDIPRVRTVVHYQLPHTTDVYVHRSGRTARASADGCSIALVSPNDSAKFATLCQKLSKESIKRFPVASSYMPEVTKCLSLARQIDKVMRKESQEKAKKSWLKRSAESLELDLDNYESEEEVVNNHKQKKAISANLNKLQEELNSLLSRPLQPKTFSHRYPAGSGVSHILQNQFEQLSKQNTGDGSGSETNKKRKSVVIGQDSIEPLQALRNSDDKVWMDVKQGTEKRRKVEDLRRKRKEEKKRFRDQRRNKKKQSKMGE